MPIGVPRIIYSWGEELPPQWTDIYNFIFRRRMVFLMQYLDDELCNQICGLLINIHMEDRSKDLEKKEIEKSGIFKSSAKLKDTSGNLASGNPASVEPKNAFGFNAKSQKGGSLNKIADRSMEDLLSSYGNSLYEEDLAIDENYTLEQYTLQKITLEWLNWNAQFFDYSDEPYLFYLAEILSKDFTKDETAGQLLYNFQKKKGFFLVSPFDNQLHIEKTIAFKTQKKIFLNKLKLFFDFKKTSTPMLRLPHSQKKATWSTLLTPTKNRKKIQNALDVYSPFRSILNLASLISKDKNFKLQKLLPYTLDTFDYSSYGEIKTPPLKNEKEGVSVSTNKNSQNIKGNETTLLVERKSSFLGQTVEGTLSQKKETTPHEKELTDHNFKKQTDKLISENFVVKRGGSLRNLKGLLLQFKKLNQKPGITKLLGILASSVAVKKNTNTQKQISIATKVLGQRNLKKEYTMDNTFGDFTSSPWSKPKTTINVDPKRSFSKQNQNNMGQTISVLRTGNSAAQKQQKKQKALNYLDFDTTSLTSPSYLKKKRGFASPNQVEFARKQTKKALQEEESKKVFVIINSFGGSVGNGITVHDALQFIKAGSLTLGLGVAASAASLVLAGGTISERYVTEGCHVMIHQPEGGLNGQASDIWIDSQEIMKIRLDVAEIYSLSSVRPLHKILKDLDRDFYLTATETIHYGLADEIASNDVLSSIIEETSKVWDYHDSKQQRLLEARNQAQLAVDTQTQI